MLDTPIADLQPFKDHALQSTAIKAEISLIWPYSSSHASAALLLVEPDHRKRHERGQIRVIFRGPAAKALAQARPSIGDVLRLDLSGAKWQERDSRALALTPGKAVDAELVFERRAHVRVVEDAQGNADTRVIDLADPTPQHSPKRARHPPSTPAPRAGGRGGALGLTTPLAGGYASPAFMKRLRLSQEHFLESPGLAQSQDELDSSGPRKRRRTAGEAPVEYKLAADSPIRGVRRVHDSDDEEESAGMSIPARSQKTTHQGPSSLLHAESLPDSSSVAEPSSLLDPSSLQDPSPFEDPSPRQDPSSLLHGPSLQDPSSQHRGSLGEQFTIERSHLPPQATGPTLDTGTTSVETHAVSGESPKSEGENHAPGAEGIVQGIDNKAAGDAPRSPSQDRRQSVNAPMPPPPAPRLQMPPPLFPLEPERPRTPELKPSSANTLPLPSPFPQTPLAQPIQGEGRAANGRGYFSSPSRGDLASSSQQLGDASAPLSSVLRDPDPPNGPGEGQRSPSEGSEADVSSGNESPVDTEPRMFDVAPAEHASKENVDRVELKPVSLDPQESAPDLMVRTPVEMDNSIFEDDAQYSPVVGSDEVSSLPEPSDDDTGNEEGTVLPADILEEKSSQFGDGADYGPLHDAEFLSKTNDGHREQIFNGDFGFDGGHMSRIMGTGSSPPPMLSPQRAELLAPADQEVEDVSQDEDAAFAAMDDAIRHFTGHSMQDLSPTDDLAVLHPRLRTMSPFDLHVNGDVKEDVVKAEPAEGEKRDSAQESIVQQNLQEEPPPELEDSATTPAPPTSSGKRLSLKELKEQAGRRARALASTQPVPNERTQSPEVEEVDLTKFDTAPVPPLQQHPVSEAYRVPSVPDSASSPATILVLGSSRPSSRGMDAISDPRTVEASQELGETQYKASTRHEKLQQHMLPIDEDGTGEEDDADFDDKLLATLDQKDQNASLEASHQTVTSNQQPAPPRRKYRFSVNPAALADYFGPKPASVVRRQTTSALPDNAPASTAPPARQRRTSISPPPLRRHAHSQGLATSLSYFTPLNNLDLHLNTPTAKIDVLAVVTQSNTEPRRAKKGPRDWYTVFHIIDIDLWEAESQITTPDGPDKGKGKAEAEADPEDPLRGRGVRVEVFRPWKASLPVVAAGEVVLLRAFAVRSKGRKECLLSGEESGWCVFRQQHDGAGGGSGNDDDTEGTPREEMRGPPIEVGDEERRRAGELRGWYELVERVEGRLANGHAKGRVTL